MRLFLTILLCQSLTLLTYSQYSDFGSWYSASFSKEVVKDVGVEIGGQIRLSENNSFMESALVDVDLDYKFNKWLKPVVSYRYSLKNDYRTFFMPKHRLQLGLSFVKKTKPADFQLRTIYQIGVGDLNEGGWYYPESYWRNKFQVKIDLDKKFEPYIAGELFYQLDYNYGLDRYRLAAGLNWDLPKKMELKTGYLFQQEIRVADPLTEHVVQIGFSKKL